MLARCVADSLFGDSALQVHPFLEGSTVSRARRVMRAGRAVDDTLLVLGLPGSSLLGLLPCWREDYAHYSVQ